MFGKHGNEIVVKIGFDLEFVIVAVPGLMAANHEHQVIGDFGNFDNLSRARNFIHI